MKWPKACLGDVAQVVSGATPKSSVDEYWDGDIPWITPADLSGLEGKEVSATARRITEAGLSSCSSRILPPRSVLFSSRAPIGHVAINTVPMATNQGFKSFVPDHEILSSDFLYWWLKLNKAYLQSLGRGATFKEVSKEIVESIEIPLPPMEEQRRIAAILDKAHQVKELSRQRDLQLQKLEVGLFFESFGNPITNALGWPTVNIGKIARVQTGNTPPRMQREYYGDEVEWIKSDNLNNSSYYATKASECLSAVGARLARIAPRDAILVTCIAGSPACIGNCAMVDRAVAFNQQINSLEEIDGNPHFFYAMFRLFKEIVQAASTNSMKGMVSKSRFENICIITPPRDQQDLFAAKIAMVRRLQGQANELPTRADTLMQGVYKAFFMGPQVP